MNKPIRGVEPGSVAEDQIAEHLAAHPEFFERHPSVLARLQLPHQRGSAAISLVERQVLVLREKHETLEQKLQELIEKKARGEKIAVLSPRRLKPTESDGLLEALEASLKKAA